MDRDLPGGAPIGKSFGRGRTARRLRNPFRVDSVFAIRTQGSRAFRAATLGFDA
jgi:hypothetical protein